MCSTLSGPGESSTSLTEDRWVRSIVVRPGNPAVLDDILVFVIGSDGASLRQGGDSGPAIVPGDPAGSLLIQAIAYEDEALQMPPKGRLPADVLADFRKWVQMGAPDPREGAAAAAPPGRKAMTAEEARD